MFTGLKKLFERADTTASQIDPAEAAAALMFEVAWADHDVAAAELTLLLEVLQHQFAIDAVRAEQIYRIIRDEQNANVGLFPFTRALNEQLSADDKFAIVCALWQIALADADLSAFEEHTIRKIADLLYVPHSRFIEAKLIARRGAAAGT